MNDQFDTNPSEEAASQPAPDFSAAFDAMDEVLADVPAGDFITLRHGSGSPVYVPLFNGEEGPETGLTVRQAVDRAGLTVGSVNVYVDQNPITFDTFVAAGTVVTLVGNVKGG